MKGLALAVAAKTALLASAFGGLAACGAGDAAKASGASGAGGAGGASGAAGAAWPGIPCEEVRWEANIQPVGQPATRISVGSDGITTYAPASRGMLTRRRDFLNVESPAVVQNSATLLGVPETAYCGGLIAPGGEHVGHTCGWLDGQVSRPGLAIGERYPSEVVSRAFSIDAGTPGMAWWLMSLEWDGLAFAAEFSGLPTPNGEYPLRRSRFFVDGTEEKGEVWGQMPHIGFAQLNGRFFVETNPKNGMTFAVAAGPSLMLTGHDRAGKRMPKTEGGYRTYDFPLVYNNAARLSVADDELLVAYLRTDHNLALQRFSLEGEPMGGPALARSLQIHASYDEYEDEVGFPRKVGGVWYTLAISSWDLRMHTLDQSGVLSSRQILWDETYDCIWRRDCGPSDAWAGGLAISPVDIRGGPDGSVWVAFSDGTAEGVSGQSFRVLKVDDKCVSKTDRQRALEAKRAAAKP